MRNFRRFGSPPLLPSFAGWALLALASVTSGCAGPTTPFGPLEIGSGDGRVSQKTESRLSNISISTSPRRQLYHRPSALKIQLLSRSTLPENISLQVTYNGRNVSKAFRRFAQTNMGSAQQLEFIYENLRLRPDRRHDIRFLATVDTELLATGRLLPPDCPVDEARAIASTDVFEPPPRYLESIDHHSKAHQLSPTFLAGLIAQESGFDPEAVSTARALGLTQVTPLADEEIRKVRPHWRRDPRIENSSSAEIEELILDRELSKRTDWRLNPDQAIEGGALYLDYIREYWNSVENKNLLSSYPEIAYEDVILASYNSGAWRVKSRIYKRGSHWIEDDDLREAYKYVNNVRSYCYHFSAEAQ